MSATTLGLSRPVEPRRGLQGVGLAGGAVIAATSVVFEPAFGWSGVLTAAVYGIELALGGAVFLAIQAASGARWWLPLRRVPLRLAGTLVVPAAALVACLLLALPTLYPWARPGAMESPLLQTKALWLSVPLFLARALIIVGVWLSLVSALRRRLGAWEADPAPPQARRLARASVVFLILLAITLSVASWDWTMSLEPEWFSTMYGVYAFAGTFLSGIAAVTLLGLLLDRASLLPEPLSDSCRHDLGKLLFAFSTFWAYIWFCQYMLIWYTNLPEETGHYAVRLGGEWSMLFHLNPILNWVVPFVVLIAATPKRNAATLGQVAAVVLLGRWLDVYLLIAPATAPAQGLPIPALAATVAVLSGMGLLWVRALRREAGESRRER